LVELWCLTQLDRTHLVDYFAYLFQSGLKRKPDQVWNDLVNCSCQIHPGELMEEIRRAFADNLIDPWYVGLEDAERDCAAPVEAIQEQSQKICRGYIKDTINETSWWACFEEPSPSELEADEGDFPLDDSFPEEWSEDIPAPETCWNEIHSKTYVRLSPKIGRNEPCPCGSGRKYKKCCGL
jgi:hypothetical protein